MIPIIEELLESTIKTHLRVIRNNPEIIEKVFDYSNTPYGSKFKEYILNNEIKVVKGFPRDASQLPCFCIMLGAEQETPYALGDTLGCEDDTFYLTDDFQVKRDRDNLYIDTGRENTTTVVSLNNLNTGKEIVNCKRVENENNKVILFENAEEDDTVQATIGYLCDSADKRGTLMSFSYRIECWTDNSELCTYMYHLLKFIMLFKRQLLIENGIIKPILQGTDLEPVPDYFPVFVYRRSLIVSGQAENYYDAEEVNSIIINSVKVKEHFYPSNISIISKGVNYDE